MAFSFPDHFRFADSHEYAFADDALVRIGISEFAVDQLGDIVFVDLPDEGTAIVKGESFGSVESVKAVEDMYAQLVEKLSIETILFWQAQRNFKMILMVRDGC